MRGAGAPAEPAQLPGVRLPRTFLPTQYTARLVIDPRRPTFDGTIAIAGKLAARTSVIWLHGYHLKIGKATARRDGAGADLPLTITPRGEDLLEVRAAVPLDPGSWTLSIE